MTEKNYNPEQNKAKTMAKEVKTKAEAPVKKEEKKAEEKKNDAKPEAKKTEKKQEKKIIKKDEAVANGISLPISTKDSVAVCKFIRGKMLDKAISDLEEVKNFKRAIPMKGEIPHRKGKGMAGGRYLTKPVTILIRILKDLKANANVNGIEEPVITEAIPNRASQPYGRFGAVRRKRTHVKIKCAEKSKIKGKKK